MTMDTSLYPALTRQEAFHPDSRLWIYVAERPLTDSEASWLQAQLNAFTMQWTAHNAALKATGELFDRQVILLMVDETEAGASGCSIDSSVHFLEKAARHLGVDLFDRLRFGWVENGQVHFDRQEVIEEKLRSGVLSTDTLMLNTLVPTRRALAEQWLKPLHQSWHRRVFKN
jgi:hypothetical protein